MATRALVDRNVHSHPARRRLGAWGSVLSVVVVAGCRPGASPAGHLSAQEPLTSEVFGSLVARISEPGGYFDTDNLISNETGYLNVIDALDEVAIGGAYLGVGPDQSFSYIAHLRPSVAFIVDLRRDNLLHHLLLKALVQRAPTRVEFLAGLFGRAAPRDPTGWRDRDLEEILAFVDEGTVDPEFADRLQDEILEEVASFGVPLSADDLDTIRRFQRTFVVQGLGLRFTSYGRPPQRYYPTFRQLALETDIEGDRASYLAGAEEYEFVRALELANRIIPVVGDLAGAHALRELGVVMGEMGVELSAFYASNVEYYLWQDGTFPRWVENLARLPAREDAVVIRSYFPNFGVDHPSAVPGYYATQSLQPVGTLLSARFSSYWDVVTRGVVPLR